MKMCNFDVCALGELLIDFTENGRTAQGNPLMEANPGGAPCNVLALLSKLGFRTAFIGKVGEDIFGRQLKSVLEEEKIDARSLIADKQVRTTLAFVHTKADGDREFSFYRNLGADMMLREEDVDENLIAQSRIFHFGSLSMTHEGCERATKKAVCAAKKANCLISFDPNLRENLWNSLDRAEEKIRFGISQCDILKISDNEIEWLTRETDLRKAAESLRKTFPNIKLLLVSLGKDGSLACSGENCAYMPSAPAKTIETTGAGDTFCGAVLSKVLNIGWRAYSADELENILAFANSAAAIVTERKGALRVMPSRAEIEERRAMLKR